MDRIEDIQIPSAPKDPELQKMEDLLEDGRISQKEFDKFVDEFYPVD